MVVVVVVVVVVDVAVDTKTALLNPLSSLSSFSSSSPSLSFLSGQFRLHLLVFLSSSSLLLFYSPYSSSLSSPYLFSFLLTLVCHHGR